MTTQELKEQYSKLRQALEAVTESRKKFIQAAQNASERNIQSYADVLYKRKISASQIASYEAYQAMNNAIEADGLAGIGAPHPLGTKYYEWNNKLTGYSGEGMRQVSIYTLEKTGEIATLEAVTRTSRFPENLGYRGAPALGTFILRLHKKNGELGLKYLSVDASGWYSEGFDPNAIKRKREAEAKQREEQQRQEQRAEREQSFLTAEFPSLVPKK